MYRLTVRVSIGSPESSDVGRVRGKLKTKLNQAGFRKIGEGDGWTIVLPSLEHVNDLLGDFWLIVQNSPAVYPRSEPLTHWNLEHISIHVDNEDLLRPQAGL